MWEWKWKNINDNELIIYNSPRIDFFNVNKKNLVAGERVTFNWNTTNATKLLARVNNGKAIDITNHGLDGFYYEAEFDTNAIIDLIALDDKGNSSSIKTLNIQVVGSTCDRRIINANSCQYNGSTYLGSTLDGTRAWYHAICRSNNKFYRCDGNSNWVEVGDY